MNTLQELSASIRDGTSFGKVEYRDKYAAFSTKVLAMLIPGVVLGHYMDQYINKMRREKVLGDRLLTYIVLQTFASVTTIYALQKYSKSFAEEFQNTFAGLFFVAFFFGMQGNYAGALQELMGKL